MSRWLFALLLVLNGAVFVWGYQRERSQEPTLPPVPQGPYKIVLLSEANQKTPEAKPPAPTPQPAKTSDQGGNDLGFPAPADGGENAESGLLAAPGPAAARGQGASGPETSAGSVSISSGQPIQPPTTTTAPHRRPQSHTGRTHD
jgi:hypothetical protein